MKLDRTSLNVGFELNIFGSIRERYTNRASRPYYFSRLLDAHLSLFKKLLIILFCKCDDDNKKKNVKNKASGCSWVRNALQLPSSQQSSSGGVVGTRESESVGTASRGGGRGRPLYLDAGLGGLKPSRSIYDAALERPEGCC